MKRMYLSLLVGLAAAAPAPGAEAQLPGGISLTLEVVPSLGLPAGGFTGTNPGPGAGSGAGIGAGGTLGLRSGVAAYGDYQYTRFSCGGCADGGIDAGMSDRGWEAGLQLAAPVRVLGLRPWIRGGVLGHQLRFAGSGGSVVSDPSLGFALGAGTYLPLGPLEVVPGLRYRSYDAKFTFGALPSRSTRVSFVTAELGLAYRF